MTNAQIGSSRVRRFQLRVLQWYRLYRRDFPWRRRSRTRYEVVVSEILLQRTRAETVKTYYRGFLHAFPSWSALAGASEASLCKVLEPIGLWRQRAAVLRSLSHVVNKSGGRLPRNRPELERLPGIGQYIASAVLSICYNKPEPLLDINMARLLERYFGPRKLADIRYDPYLQVLSRRVLPNRRVREFNWAMLDFASMVCTSKNPSHDQCPLRTHCSFWKLKKRQIRSKKRL
jgi:A/G-specific adenine glycosylase